MLKVGHLDVIKGKLDSFGVWDCTLLVLPQGMYPACAMS